MDDLLSTLSTPGALSRILYARTDAIGDAVLSAAMLPALRRRFPSASMQVLCQEHLVEFYEACPLVDGAIGFQKQACLRDPAAMRPVQAQLESFAPELILNPVFSREAVCEALLAGVRTPALRIAIEGDCSNLRPREKAEWDRQYDHLVPHLGARTELERHAAFLAGLGIGTGPLEPSIWTREAEEREAGRLFQENGLARGRVLAVFPGAQHACRVYPHYGEALAGFSEGGFLLLGGSDAADLGEALARELPGPLLNLVGKTSLPLLAALLKRCRLYVGAESAGAHVACAVGIPNVVVMGGGHYGRFMPYSALTSIVALPLECYHCNWSCRYERPHCVQEIPPALVQEAVRERLSCPPAKTRIHFTAPEEWPSLPNRPAWMLPAAVGQAAELSSGSRRVSAAAGEPGDAEPWITAIVSTYRGERWIGGCLDNLLRQTLGSRIEILVIDSGSPENERDIVESYQKRHPRLRYLRTDRETLYAAWNRGVRMARGRYVTNANVDDAHRPDAFERMVEMLEAHPDCELAYAHTAWTQVPNDRFETARPVRWVHYPPFHPALPLFYCLTGCFPVWRRSLFDRIGLFDADLHAAGDYEMLLRFSAAGGRALLVPEVLSLFYQNPEGLTQQSTRSQEEEVAVRERFRKSIQIERLFQTEGTPASRAQAWLALGTMAMDCPVPWLDYPLHDPAFALACFQKAYALAPESRIARQNTACLLKATGRTGELQAWMRLADPETAAEIQRICASPVETFQRVHCEPAHQPPAPRSAEPGASRSEPGRPTAPSSPLLQIPVRWIGPVFNPSGYASEALHYLLPLAGRLDLGLLHANSIYSERYVAGLPPADRRTLFALRDRYPLLQGGIVISHMPANGFQPVPDAEHLIGRTMFETDRLPSSWVARCNQMDEIWVPSRFNLETFAAAGVAREKLWVCPESLDAETFDPDRHEALPLEERAAFNFLAVFEWSSRKGWDVLLAAWFQEFSGEEDVCLHLRTYLYGRPEAEAARELQEEVDRMAQAHTPPGKKRARVSLISRQIASLDLPRLYKAVDCLVAPSRGEGWGRPHHEAMMMGLPVIATAWSGNTEFMNEENSYPLEFTLKEARGLEPALWNYRGHRWAEPSVPHLRQLMRHVLDHPEERREKGRRARQQMVEHYSREPVAHRILERLREIECRLRAAALPPAATRAAAGPEPPPCGERPIQVAWEGSFLDFGSLSQVNRCMTEHLHAAPGLHLARVQAARPVRGMRPEFESLARKVREAAPSGTEVTVRHAWPPSWDPPARGRWILQQPWEFGALPAEWVERMEGVDQIWVPSEYCRKVCVDSGVPREKIRVVPNGVDPERFRPDVRPRPLRTSKTFKFLFVGGLIPRKGIDLLLRAYASVFRRTEDVCLVIKRFGGGSVYDDQGIQDQIRSLAGDPSAPEILMVEEEIGGREMAGLYTACDCLVHPYRGEGFGLPILEAMACGIPVLITGGGAADDFAGDDHAWRIPARRRALGMEVDGIRLARPGWLLEPDLAALEAHLRFLFEHRALARERAESASRYVRTHWSWAQAARVAARHLREVATRQEPARPAAPPLSATPPPELSSLGNLEAARMALRNGMLAEAWRAAAAALEERPFHPEAAHLLACVAEAANHSELAGRCAEQARQMAPGWTPPAPAADPPPKEPLPLTAELPPCWGRWAERPRLSACLIVRNEELRLRRCLQSLADVAEEIVVVDTGSSDGTLEIARSFGARTAVCPWEEDFSRPRNLALSLARGDWIFVIDADEELPAAQVPALRRAMAERSVLAWRIPIQDRGREAEGAHFVPRLFRNAPGIWFQGRIHEQCFASLEAAGQAWGLRSELGGPALLHHGYAAVETVQRSKNQRNLRLLELGLEEDPSNPHLHMSLGMELVRAGHLEEGLRSDAEAQRCLEQAAPGSIPPELLETFLNQYGSHLMRARAFSRIARLFASPLARGQPLSASLHLMAGMALLEERAPGKALAHFKQCIDRRSIPGLCPANPDIFKAAPHHCLALACLALERTAEAEAALRRALEDDPDSAPARLDLVRLLARKGGLVEALQEAHALMSRHPEEVQVWTLGGDLALKRPEFLEFALDWTGEAMKHFPMHPLIRAQRGEAEFLSGHWTEALQCWKGTLENRPPFAGAVFLIHLDLDQLTGREAPPAPLAQQVLHWYRKLAECGAEARIHAIHDKLPSLERLLPEAGRVIRQVLQEAERAA